MKAMILTLFLAGCGTLQLCVGTCDVASGEAVKGVYKEKQNEATQAKF